MYYSLFRIASGAPRRVASPDDSDRDMWAAWRVREGRAL